MKNQETTFWHTRNRQRIEQQRVTNSLDLINLRAKQQHKKRWNDLSEISEDSNDDYLDEMIADEITSVVSEKSDKDSIGNLATKNEMIKEMMSLYQCGENLKQRVRIICVGGGLYAYNGVCYDKVDNNELMTIYRDKVDKTLHNSKSLNVMGNLYKFLQTDSEIQATIDYSAVDDLAVLKNGVFDVRNQKLMKHSEKYMFMYRINASYTMEDETPLFDEFLENVTGGESVLIKRMWYLIAYLCMHSVAAKCFFVLGTAPNSGKSVFGRFIQSLFDAKFVSSIALNDMNREFSLGPIVGKAVNVSMDLPATKLNAAAVSKLKMLTGDDMITINEKHVPEFSYYNRAKFLFASNHPVSLTEDDEAFWNRLVYFPFNYSIPKDQQDTKLFDKLLEERDAIVSKALRYGKKFIKNNYTFPTTPEIEETLSIWKGERNYSVENFLRDCCDVKESYVGEWTSVLYAAYEDYCEKCEKESVSSETFRQILKMQQGIKSKKFRKNSASENPRAGFTGIKLLQGMTSDGGDENVIDN